jgi:putative radical SAM enzyme (TIGR03279 family)
MQSNMASKETFGRILKIASNSPMWAAGVRPGDELISIDSQQVRDVLDYRYLSAEEEFEIEIRRDGQLYEGTVLRTAGEDLGLEFEDDLFDGMRSCRNNCIFCFVRQMPKGLRKSLYQRDDDYRLSLMYGNYITLTNLTDEDMDRICSQRMSPLYVSVHATETELRSLMLRNEDAGRIMEQLRRFADARLTVHAQIVLCPGVNDGEHLERTIGDLASLHPWVASIAVVPVGLTKHRNGLMPLRSFDAESARPVLDMCMRFQKDFKRRLGTRLVFPSDEFYLLAGADIPSREAYEGFPQLEDGAGVSRLFLDDLRRVSARIGRLHIRPGRYVLVTGTLALPFVERLADLLGKFEGVSARVCAVKNDFLGETVTVAGLLSGRDIAAALVDVGSDEEVLIPGIALNEGHFLDGVSVDDLREGTGAQITVVPPMPEGAAESLGMAKRRGFRRKSSGNMIVGVS